MGGRCCPGVRELREGEVWFRRVDLGEIGRGAEVHKWVLSVTRFVVLGLSRIGGARKVEKYQFP